jgi:hypothetical protein
LVDLAVVAERNRSSGSGIIFEGLDHNGQMDGISYVYPDELHGFVVDHLEDVPASPRSKTAACLLVRAIVKKRRPDVGD